MSWSWKIARIAGIPIFVHWTFLILIGWLLLSELLQGHDLATALVQVGFILALFGCVVLHELGHAMAARYFGVPTASITLLPIGGVARLQRIPEHPPQELIVALAGPAVNVVIVAVLWALGVPLPGNVNDPQHLVQAQFWPKLLVVNAFLFLFNLLPAFPMDGGRVLRALLAMRLEYAHATRIAASIGQAAAIGFVLYGLIVPNPFLLLIALFVWIGAESEAVQVEERVVLGGVQVREAMLTDYRTLGPSDTLSHAADLLLAGTQHDFLVVNADGQAEGLLTRADLMNGLSRVGPEARVAEFARPGVGTVEAGAPLGPAMIRLREGEGPCLQVVELGRRVGLLTLENVGEYLMVRAALSAQAERHKHHELAHG
jgi:Zn-dependent protease/CBS domain-containing protein